MEVGTSEKTYKLRQPRAQIAVPPPVRTPAARTSIYARAADLAELPDVSDPDQFSAVVAP